MRRYYPEIRRAIRIRLTDPRLRRVLDSLDVCQSVFANFLIRVAAGEFNLDHPGDVAALLTTMARNKLVDQVRRLQAACRDQRRVQVDHSAVDVAAGSALGPGEQVERAELLDEVRKRLTDAERQLADLRNDGWEWSAIADRLGGNPEALRKQLTRALDRVARELRLAEGDE